jgi:ATP synthase protein I
MQKEPEVGSEKDRTAFSREVGAKAARKLKAQDNAKKGVWFGLGMMGLVGWSVVVPTLLGVVAGIRLDNDHPGKFSWTLTFLIIGLCLGCLNAWYWVTKEDKKMQEGQEDHDNNDI